MNLVHLTASTFFGGPERQMLGLAAAMRASVRSTFAVFPERGRAAAFVAQASTAGFMAVQLANDFPQLFASVCEIAELVRTTAADVLVCHGYKAHILGRLAARRTGIPAVAVSRGWTGESLKVKLYEWLDRRHLRFMDHVVCVSNGQAEKVRKWCRVSAQRLSVIHNSARLGAFEHADPHARTRLHAFFPSGTAISHIVLGAGRLSPEKGFDILIKAATTICREQPGVGVIIFGEGQLRTKLETDVARSGLTGQVVLPGFRPDLDSLISGADVVVLPSYTEGLPNVALEASAAGVPVVATAVGGTPEVIADGQTGFLVEPGSPAQIATRVTQLLRNADLRTRLGAAGRERMRQEFTFEAQAAAYLRLFRFLCSPPTIRTTRRTGCLHSSHRV